MEKKNVEKYIKPEMKIIELDKENTVLTSTYGCEFVYSCPAAYDPTDVAFNIEL